MQSRREFVKEMVAGAAVLGAGTDLAWGETSAAKKSKVARPLECVIGCSNCKGICEAEAIGFPPLSMLTDLRQGWARANPCKCQKQ